MVGMTICFGPADRLLGNLAALLGRDRDAEGHYRMALELARRSESPVWEAHVLADHSRFLRRRGAQKRAAELGQRARQIAESLGMEGLAARARADIAAVAEGVSGDPVSPGPSLPDGLSAREWEVLELVATGSSNRESAKSSSSVRTRSPTTSGPSSKRPAAPTAPRRPPMPRAPPPLPALRPATEEPGSGLTGGHGQPPAAQGCWLETETTSPVM